MSLNNHRIAVGIDVCGIFNCPTEPHQQFSNKPNGIVTLIEWLESLSRQIDIVVVEVSGG